MEIVMQTALSGLELASRDDVHDIYVLPQEKQLVVYTDRMAVSGQALDNPVPYRGVMFSQISLYWMNKFTHLVGNNLVAQAVERFPQGFQAHAAQLKGRSVIAQKLRLLPMTFRVIGNLIGAEWQAYKETRIVGGKSLPKGLREGDRIENPIMIVLPSAEILNRGVDDPTKWAQRMFGPMLFKNLEDICLSIYGVARGYAGRRGIVIADTHFEFGVHEGTPYIIGDVMTPETSTYWSADTLTPGQPQAGMDRKPLLDWLAAEGWESPQPLPEVPQEVIAETSKRCRAIFDVMTGKIPLPEQEDQAAV